MSKRTTSVLIALTVLVLTATVVFMYVYTTSLRTNASSQVESQSQVSGISYIIKDYFGKVAVFEGEQSAPFRVLDTYTSTLPTYDRQLLKEGITVTGEDALRKLIEDFTS